MLAILDESHVSKLIGVFVLFALSYYGYVYAYEFNEGVSSAPFAIKALKDIVYFGVASILAAIAWRSRSSPSSGKSALVFMPFAIALFATSIIHAPQTGLAQQLWHNIKNVAIFIPIFSLPFFFSHQTCSNITTILFRVILLSVTMQCLFVMGYHGLGGQLWLDGLKAGLVGNPNSFALLLNLTSAIILSRLGTLKGRQLAFALIALSAIVFFMLETTSASQLVIFFGLFAVCFFFRPMQWKPFGLALVICVTISVLERQNFADAVYALKGTSSVLRGLEDAQGNHESLVSLSVTGRVKDITDALSILKGDFATILFGNFESSTFRPMDGQFWVLLYNNGLFGTLAFACGVMFVYLRSAISAWRVRDDNALALHLMIAAFSVSFLASRVLMYFPFNFLFFLVAGLAVRLPYRQGTSDDIKCLDEVVSICPPTLRQSIRAND
jgi:hypothetical protein